MIPAKMRPLWLKGSLSAEQQDCRDDDSCRNSSLMVDKARLDAQLDARLDARQDN
jgi:hypothetical protein